MTKLRFIGLDVHKRTTDVAIAEQGDAPPEFYGTVPSDTPRLTKLLKKLGRGVELRCCYEAGPTGFALYRALRDAGIDCVVVAPSCVPDTKGGVVKTNKRDARRLARFLRSGDLVAIHVPDGQTEAFRDLSRAREDAYHAVQTARQQLSGFLLRHGRAYPGKHQGTKAHLEWIRSQEFEHETQKRVLAKYIAAYESAVEREKELEDDIRELLPSWMLEPVVRALMAFRGIDVISAVMIVAEIGDFVRFPEIAKFPSYLGMTPGENSTGDDKRRGRVTRAGNAHVRRVVIEASWGYRYRTLSPAIRKRGLGTLEAVRLIAQKAQTRLSKRYLHLLARGKEKNKVAMAIGRELSCFLCAAATHPEVQELVRRRKEEQQRLTAARPMAA